MEKSFILIYFLLFSIFVDDVVSRGLYSRGETNGDTDADGRIVGGYDITILDVPYQAYLTLQKGVLYYQCGGSIISKTYVLTAAHCLTGISRIYVNVGSAFGDNNATQYSTSRYKQHPFYNPLNSDYDVGLINVRGGMSLDGENTKAVQLPAASTTIAPGTNIIVTGWGTTTENGQVSENLMAVQVQTISNDECLRSYSTLTSRQFCAGVPGGGKDSCQGDSGGPAVATDSGLQIGIVSFGIGCARPGYPGVYTNVSKVRWWIRLISHV